jgi:serine phosphatase RsbU (regulator of sigma subunit)
MKIDIKQILDSMVNRISNTMHIEKVAVTILTKADCECLSKNIDSCLCRFSDSSEGLYNYLRKTKIPQSFGLLFEEYEQISINPTDKQKLLDSGIVLAVPMFLKDNLVGIILVGEKLSGKFYSQEDIDLLLTVANQAAIAVENARLYESEIEKQKIQEELSLARKIQQGLLPKIMPDIGGVNISAISSAAEMVGGDYYDLIQISDNKFYVVVADVSGKGISAALYMSKIQGMIQLAARMYKSPKELLTEVNRRIYDGIERKSFITMVMALFDFESNVVTICRAGHNKPVVAINDDFQFLDSEGMGLGLEAGDVFDNNLKEIKISLEHSKFFLFYSDGLTEMMNPDYLEFGEDRLMDFVKTNHSKPVIELKNQLMNEINSFRGTAEQHDDLTFVIVKLD